MTTTDALTMAVDAIAHEYYVRSWGYDQTNVDFYKIVGRTPKGVRVQHWTSVAMDKGSGTTYVLPGDGPAVVQRERFEPGSPELEACSRCRAYTDGFIGPWSMAYACRDCEAHRSVSEPAPVTFHRLRDGSDWIKINDYDIAQLWNGAPEYETAPGWGH